MKKTKEQIDKDEKEALEKAEIKYNKYVDSVKEVITIDGKKM